MKCDDGIDRLFHIVHRDWLEHHDFSITYKEHEAKTVNFVVEYTYALQKLPKMIFTKVFEMRQHNILQKMDNAGNFVVIPFIVNIFVSYGFAYNGSL